MSLAPPIFLGALSERLTALPPSWGCGIRLLAFVQNIKSQEKIPLTIDFWDIAGK